MNNYSHIIIFKPVSKSFSLATIFGKFFIRVVLFNKNTNSSRSHAPRGIAYQNQKPIWWTLTTLFILLVLTACTQEKPTLNIAVASNFEPTLKKIIQQYPNKQYKINIIAGSSGVLTNQILNNAPYDLFLSADTDKTESIYKKLNLKTKPVVYAIGQLALWIPEIKDSNCLQQLSTIKTLAMPNPKTAPYGKAAQSILKANNIKVEKIIQTANASQAYIYTKDRLTQAGFVPYSMSMNEDKGCLEVFGDLELEQGMVLIDDKAVKFYKFIQTLNIQNLIRNFGYF